LKEHSETGSEKNLEADSEMLLELARYAFLRLDGAWFLAIAEKYGVEIATELDVRAWEQFSERLAKKIVSLANLQGKFSEVFPKLMSIHSKLMNMNREIFVYDNNRAISRITDCEVWKMVSKVWTRETAPCYKVTQASIRGLLKGAFPGTEFIINHNKKIPLGDSCCEVEIIMKPPE
jgi:hypothetical protein